MLAAKRCTRVLPIAVPAVLVCTDKHSPISAGNIQWKGLCRVNSSLWPSAAALSTGPVAQVSPLQA